MSPTYSERPLFPAKAMGKKGRSEDTGQKAYHPGGVRPRPLVWDDHPPKRLVEAGIMPEDRAIGVIVESGWLYRDFLF